MGYETQGKREPSRALPLRGLPKRSLLSENRRVLDFHDALTRVWPRTSFVSAAFKFAPISGAPPLNDCYRFADSLTDERIRRRS
jgi:hypothetical protein